MVTFSEISPSEFFYRNRDLAGFTNPARALYMAVRELVENSLDACELAGILPDVYVRIVADGQSGETPEPRAYRLTVADNGPGVDPREVPRAFGKVFYGSKYVLRQSRGMFGMGGTMAILYGQITSNRPVKITTSTDGKNKHIFEMLIDIGENKPIILRRDVEEANGKTGTRVDIDPRGGLHALGPEDRRVLQADRARGELRQPDLCGPDREDHHLRTSHGIDAATPHGDVAPSPRHRRGGFEEDDQDHRGKEYAEVHGQQALPPCWRDQRPEFPRLRGD